MNLILVLGVTHLNEMSLLSEVQEDYCCILWSNGMDTLYTLLVLCVGIHRLPAETQHTLLCGGFGGFFVVSVGEQSDTTPKLVAKILNTNFGFVPDWWAASEKRCLDAYVMLP